MCRSIVKAVKLQTRVNWGITDRAWGGAQVSACRHMFIDFRRQA
jgi:hypothetical protein